MTNQKEAPEGVSFLVKCEDMGGHRYVTVTQGYSACRSAKISRRVPLQYCRPSGMEVKPSTTMRRLSGGGVRAPRPTDGLRVDAGEDCGIASRRVFFFLENHTTWNRKNFR